MEQKKQSQYKVRVNINVAHKHTVFQEVSGFQEVQGPVSWDL